MALALITATAAAGQQLSGLLSSYGYTASTGGRAKRERIKRPNPELQAAAEAKRQRRAERNRKQEGGKA